MFNSDNMTWPVKPLARVADGGTVKIYCMEKSIQKDYVYITRYYDNASSWQEIVEKNIPYKEPESKTVIGYGSDGKLNGSKLGHSHGVSLGSVRGAYRVVAVTGQRGYAIDGTYHEYTDPVVWDGGDVQKIKVYEKNGYYDGTASTAAEKEWNNDGPVEPVYIHCIPATFRVTFKQTKDGYVNGLAVSDASKKEDLTLDEEFYSGTPLSEIMEKHAPDWDTLTDTHGEEFTPDGDWVCVQYPDGVPEGKMPAEDLEFYRNWKTGSYTVTLDYGYDDHIEDKENVAYGSAVPVRNAAYLSREGYTLTGWKFCKRIVDESGKAKAGAELTDVSFNSIVKQDLYIVAQWAPNTGFKVKYDQGEHGTLAMGASFTDPVLYRGSAAPVKYIPIPKACGGWVFTGYKAEKNGKLYDLERINMIDYKEDYDVAGEGATYGLIKLVAQYKSAKKDNSTTVTYHSNYPVENGEKGTVHVDESIIENGTFKVSSLMFPAPAGCRFVCWANKEGERLYAGALKGHYFYPGEYAAAGKEKNDLYAVWKVVEVGDVGEVVEEYISVSGIKIWDDADDKDGKRPASIRVKLIADGVERETITVEADRNGNWTFGFKDLPKYKKSDTNEKYEEIKYEVVEAEVPEGYEVSYSGNHVSGFTITNTRAPATDEKGGVVDPSDTDETKSDVLGDYEDDRADGGSTADAVKTAETSQPASSKGVNTGDEAMLILDIGIMTAAIIMAVLILIRRRRDLQ